MFLYPDMNNKSIAELSNLTLAKRYKQSNPTDIYIHIDLLPIPRLQASLNG